MSRRSFGPVVLTGLATAGLAAMAATRPWFGSGELEGAELPGMPGRSFEATYPAASAVSLVLLAAWGVLLVTRGRVRRGFALVATLAAAGLVATVVTAGASPPDGAPLTAWFWVAAAVSVLAVVPALLAFRLAPAWPEMGSRYDAPTETSGAPVAAAGSEERDLWRALDDGRDPTA